MAGSPEEKPHFLRKRYSLARVAELLEISEASVRRLVDDGELRPVRMTKRGMKFEEEEVERYYQARKKRAAARPVR